MEDFPLIYYVAKLISSLIVLTLVYLLGSFVSLSWNPAQWQPVMRFVSAICFVWFFVIVERGRGFVAPEE
ncbi:hypothetical protein KNJ79_04910 [Sphingopyxis indica]|uniref:hypothetical protein n=1 Tax=Sphingopyxis indica TaxID=436663 RepID=UPI002938D4B0|nr:hypothetical protein [Sphingopyxis indica]WOF44271.1 hypothetical protein KNJ79_04910 [Sphingopyxis indica]